MPENLPPDPAELARALREGTGTAKVTEDFCRDAIAALDKGDLALARERMLEAKIAAHTLHASLLRVGGTPSTPPAGMEERNPGGFNTAPPRKD